MSFGIVYTLITPDNIKHVWGGESFTIEQDVTLEANPAAKQYYLENYQYLYGYNFLSWFENSSLKDLGKKCFGFSLLDSSYIPMILGNL